MEQEPHLEENKTVKQIVEEAVQPIVDLLKEYEEVNNKFSEPLDDEEMNKLIIRQGELTELIEQNDAWELDSMLERAMDALNCPPDQIVKILAEAKTQNSIS